MIYFLHGQACTIPAFEPLTDEEYSRVTESERLFELVADFVSVIQALFGPMEGAPLARPALLPDEADEISQDVTSEIAAEDSAIFAKATRNLEAARFLSEVLADPDIAPNSDAMLKLAAAFVEAARNEYARLQRSDSTE